MIEVENLSKLYKLGSIGSTTLRESLNRAWYRIIGKEELGRRIGEKDLMIPPDHPQAGPEPNTFWALKDVSFTVEQGDIVGIIGRNGAGKSTLLKVLTRITEPTSGRAVLRGRVGSLLEVGTGFHPELTGRENIFLNGAILGMRRREIERKFDEIVAFAEVERFIDTPVKRYSSGMYVRLAFAVAAHLDPEILLVDEVLAVGDAAFQKKCLGKMKDVAGEGRTVLFVSHNMAAISQLCGRGMLLEQGKVTCAGPVNAVVAAYLETLTDRVIRSADTLVQSPDGSVKVLSVDILDGLGRPAAAALCGEEMTLRVCLDSRRRINDLIVGVGFNGDLDARVAVVHSSTAGFSLPLPAGESTILCRVPRFPLVPGLYWLDLHLSDRGTDVLFAPRVQQFCVESGDFHNSGRLPDQAWAGYCLLEQTWTVEAPSAAAPAAARARS